VSRTIFYAAQWFVYGSGSKLEIHQRYNKVMKKMAGKVRIGLFGFWSRLESDLDPDILD
jgi:hypothetical protein